MIFKDIFNQEELENDIQLNNNRPFQRCSISVMDTIMDPNISFDKNGVCNYYHEYKQSEKNNTLTGDKGENKLREIANEIKNHTNSKGYNCILGLSGGIDSTYLAYLSKELGLTPLLVHFDYGWNSETAIKNVQNVVEKTGFDLYTVVMDWQEFKSIQRSYFKASVIDLDVPADHMIFGALFQTAAKFKIKYVLSGNNIWTEFFMPKTWSYNKFDLTNLKNIHKTFENTPLKKLPALGYNQKVYYRNFKKIKSVGLLNYCEFKVNEIRMLITQEMGWVDYGGKHHESVFTRFYQGYILPRKFKIDKRKLHLSNLIFSDQLTRDEALEVLKTSPYDEEQMLEDFSYVVKKLNFSEQELESILSQKNIPHEFYGTDQKYKNLVSKSLKPVRPIIDLYKKYFLKD
jgi:N-acetyl sugar amidotransferase